MGDESLRLSDRALIGILLVAVAAIGTCLPGRPDLLQAFGVHALLLGGFSAVAWLARAKRQGWPAAGHTIASVGVILLLYITLGNAGFALMPWTGDALLERADRVLFLGTSPSLAAERFVTPRVLELSSAIYALYMPYLYVSIFLSCAARPARERAEFLDGLAVTFAMSYLGYLFLPARGPILYLANEFSAPLQGGFWHEAIVRSTAQTGGIHGAFPSLHVGAAAYCCLFDLRHGKLRGLAYAPFVFLITFATVVVRYHYVVDLVAGFAIALVASRLASGAFCASRPERVGQESLAGRTLTAFWRLALPVFFKNIEVEGRANVPARGPLLLVPNHANAIVDPLVIMTCLDRPVVLTAKHLLAKDPLLRAILNAHGAVLFHRRQDEDKGADPRKNEEAIEACARKLALGSALCVFPEGVSHSDPSPRPFKTGVARIAEAFLARSREPLAVLPVGLVYERKDGFRSSVLVRIGEPLDARAWLEAHGHDAATATREVEERVRALVPCFESHEERKLLASAAQVALAVDSPPAPLDRDEPGFARRTALLERIRKTGGLERGAHDLGRHVSSLEQLRVQPGDVHLSMHPARAALFVLRETEVLLAAAPLALLGVSAYALPFSVVAAIQHALSKDEDHWATNAVVPSLVVFPFFLALELLLAFLALPLWLALALAAALPGAGLAALLWRDRVLAARHRARAFLSFLRSPERKQNLASEARRLARKLESSREEVLL